MPSAREEAVAGRRLDDADATAGVALKLLEPAGHNSGARKEDAELLNASAQAALRAFGLKWQNDAQEQATRAYCIARQVGGW